MVVAVAEASIAKDNHVETTRAAVATSKREVVVMLRPREEEAAALRPSSSRLDFTTLRKKSTADDEFTTDVHLATLLTSQNVFLASRFGGKGRKSVAMLLHSVAFQFSSSVLLQQHLLAGVYLFWGCAGLLFACFGSGYWLWF